MTNAIETRNPAKKAVKTTPQIAKESVAKSVAVAAINEAQQSAQSGPATLQRGDAEGEAKAEKYRLQLEAASKLLNAFSEKPVADAKAELAALKDSGRPFVNDHRFWTERFKTASTSHGATATKLKGARRELWTWLGHVKAVEETFDDPAIGPIVRDSIERAVKFKLEQIAMLPKTPDWRKLILPAALFPDTVMSEAEKKSLQKQMSVYRNVLRQAEKEGIASAGVAAWIESRNGIERIRLNKEDPQDAKDEAKAKADAEKQHIAKYVASVRQADRKFSFTAAPADLGWDPNKDHYEMVLLATYRQSTGLVEVMQVVKGTPAFDAVARVASKQPFTPPLTPVVSADLFPNGL